MSHFAQLDLNGKVINVIVADTLQWCEDNLGGTWIQTSYSGSFGGKFAGINDTWDGENFIPPTPPGPPQQ